MAGPAPHRAWPPASASRSHRLRASAFRIAAVFAGAGAISRFLLRYFETRWQVLIFCAAAAAYQFVVRPARGKQGSAAAWLLDAVFATGAIAAMKVAIEGHL